LPCYLNKICALIVNARNANTFTGKKGYQGLREIADELSVQLSIKQKNDDEHPKKVHPNQILFGCTGTIGEEYPTEKIKESIPNLIEKIKYTQNKYIWMKAALGIMTTDLVPKLAMEECKIGNVNIKIYGIAKGSGMIFPNMATTLGYVFTDANLSSNILQKLLKKNTETTFNAISCDGDTSTNDMVSIFSTAKAKNSIIKNINDPKIKDFDNCLHSVLLNLAKRIAADGEGASKFVTVNVNHSKTQEEAKKIAFSIANSPLVKTAIAGQDPNWGRIIMAIGKANVNINLNKLSIKLGPIKIIEKGQLSSTYNENDAEAYMKEEKRIDLYIDLNMGKKSFTAYTMDLTTKYIEINADYRT
jgi:glutamate N-acetyltransferase/amino-acid N-acetyltransferase